MGNGKSGRSSASSIASSGSREAAVSNQRGTISDIKGLERLSRAELRLLWTKEHVEKPPSSLGRDILALGIAYARQERLFGGLSRPVAKELERLLARALGDVDGVLDIPNQPLPRAGTILVREWQGTTHHVMVTDEGFLWNGKLHRSLSSIARVITGTAWNGPRFFGLRDVRTKIAGVRDGGKRG
jgi:hypothetical protein